MGDEGKNLTDRVKHAQDVDPGKAFLAEVQRSGAVPIGVAPPMAASAVVCAVLTRVSGRVARELLGSLPSSVQAAIGRCDHLQDQVHETFDKRELHRRIDAHFEPTVTGRDTERLTAAVLAALRSFVPGAIATAFHEELPAELAPLWRSAT